jgi:valacyclovir hydrolase
MAIPKTPLSDAFGEKVMPKIRVHGIDFQVEDQGAGAIVLCLSGALGSGSIDFAPQLRYWTDRFRLVAPDLRGCGGTRPPMRDFPADFYKRDAEDVAALVEALGIPRFALAGWSDGANVGCLIASRYPDRVTKLAIWGGNSFFSERDMRMLARSRDVANWPHRRRADLEAIYGPDLPSLWASYCDSILRHFWGGADVCRTALASVRCPTLVLHGGRDQLLDPVHPNIFASEIGGAELHVLPEGGHSLHLSSCADFQSLVFQFL